MVHIDAPSFCDFPGTQVSGCRQAACPPRLSDTVSNRVFYIRVGVAKLRVGISGAHCSLNRAP